MLVHQTYFVGLLSETVNASSNLVHLNNFSYSSRLWKKKKFHLAFRFSFNISHKYLQIYTSQWFFLKS